MAPQEGRWSNLHWLMLAIREMNRGPEVDLGPALMQQTQWRYDTNVTYRSKVASDGISGAVPGEPISATGEPLSAFDPEAAPINVLCMDGGGIRGRCLLAMVEEMEAFLGSPVAHHFDLIAGTSIGGCGSLFLSRYPDSGKATVMARRALQELQARCFAAKQRNWGRLFSRGFLCADARQDFMLELCGPNQPLRTSGPRAFAVASRQREGGGLEPFLFRTYDLSEQAAANSHAGTSRVALWQAIEATSAAPLLFPRARFELDEDAITTPREHGQQGQQGQQQQLEQQQQPLEQEQVQQQGQQQWQQQGQQGQQGLVQARDGHGTLERGPAKRTVELWLADGGLVANDPTAIALREARALWPNRPIGTVLSLGTGSISPLGADERNTDPSRSRIGRAVRAVGGPRARYYRLNPTVKGISMIDSDEAKLQAMEQDAKTFFRHSSAAREAIARLSESASHRADYLRVESFRKNWPVTATVQRTTQGLLAWLLSCLYYVLSRIFAHLAEARHNLYVAVAVPIWRLRGLPPARQHQLHAMAEEARSRALSNAPKAPQGFGWPTLFNSPQTKQAQSVLARSRPMHASA